MEAAIALIVKALNALPILVEAGADILSIIVKMRVVAEAAQNGTVTDEQLQALEDELDSSIAAFNEPME